MEAAIPLSPNNQAIHTHHPRPKKHFPTSFILCSNIDMTDFSAPIPSLEGTVFDFTPVPKPPECAR
jgi:hypothetical protein